MLTQEELDSLANYHGVYFDPATGKTYTEDGAETGFTFERARWSGPFGLHLLWPWLNPIGFATHATGVKILEFARALMPKLSVVLDEEKKDLGPFTRTVERQIVVSDGFKQESFNAGLLANSIIRNGHKSAGVRFLAEVRLAGMDPDPKPAK
jgi:hypothetical protein